MVSREVPIKELFKKKKSELSAEAKAFYKRGDQYFRDTITKEKLLFERASEENGTITYFIGQNLFAIYTGVSFARIISIEEQIPRRRVIPPGDTLTYYHLMYLNNKNKTREKAYATMMKNFLNELNLKWKKSKLKEETLVFKIVDQEKMQLSDTSKSSASGEKKQRVCFAMTMEEIVRDMEDVMDFPIRYE